MSSTQANRKVLVIVGSGPGLGVTTGSLFASKGFDVAVLSRDSNRLSQDASRISDANPRAKVLAYPVDVGDHRELAKVLQRVVTDLGPPEVVYFNAARVRPSKIGETSADYILDDFKTMNIGLYATACWAMPHLIEAAARPGSHASFLLSNSGLWDHPIADFFALSMQKAAQHNLMGSVNQILGPRGVHVASVNIGGVLSDNDPVINVTNSANALWALYGQERGQWQSEFKVGDIEDLIRNMSGHR